MTRTFYDVLDVPADASQSAIRDAYREKVKEFHPDVCDHPDAEERFKRVKRAEEVLADPDERSTYDRVGHDQYVDDRPATAATDASADVRAAAARAAARDDGDSGGGRSAGWRERERRARGDPADWFQNDVGYDASGPRDVGATDDAPSANRDGDSDGAGGAAGAASSDTGAARAAGTAADRRARAARSPGGAAGRGHAATEAWGHQEARTHTHAVHEWAAHEPERTFSVPRLTQDELVLLAASIVVYPILLFMAVLPALPTVANVAIGLVAIAFVAFLLPRPAFAIPVFGTWSVGIPALLVGLGIPVLSLVGAVTLIGVWIPLCYSLAVAFVLMR